MSAPTKTAPGLDLFAATWLDRWQSIGGTVLVDGETHAVSLLVSLQDDHRDFDGDAWHRQWRNGYDTGRWHELQEMLELVPGGMKAVAAHVLKFPEFESQDGYGV